ncbi:MAG: hypothetical protein Q8O41_07775 [Candidatus Methanoperedens sp.]|nr:hypothetical protein [Candidatus Methanoperedens sp.]
MLNIGFASAATLNVGQGQTYATIQSAIDAAKTGDVILVDNVGLTQRIIIRSQSPLL